jgi:hypothetical protein
MTRKQKALLTAVALVGITVISALKIKGMLDRGEPVFWLSELWAPAAFLSIGLVTCLEFLVGPENAPAKAKSRRSGKRK